MPETTATVERGYFTGMLDVYVAKMITPDASTSAPTYDTPKLLGMGIEVTITPQYREGSLHASNRAVRRKKVIDRYDIKANTDAVDAETLAYVLSRAKDTAGVQMIGGDKDPDYMALGFCRTRDNGTKEFWWLLRGQMWEAAATAKTSTDNIEYQTPTLEGTFDRRLCDNQLAVVADSENSAIQEAVFTNWFGAVYEPNTGAAG